MENPVLLAIGKAVFPLIASIFVLWLAYRRKIGLGTGIGLQMPNVSRGSMCIIAWILLMSVEELIFSFFQMPSPKHWSEMPTVIFLLKAFALGFSGPVVEEIVFRGLLPQMLSKRGWSMARTIVFCAVAWAVMHFDYSPLILVFVLIDGIALGWARHYTKSIYVPIAMHMLGNFYSIYQMTSS